MTLLRIKIKGENTDLLSVPKANTTITTNNHTFSPNLVIKRDDHSTGYQLVSSLDQKKLRTVPINTNSRDNPLSSKLDKAHLLENRSI